MFNVPFCNVPPCEIVENFVMVNPPRSAVPLTRKLLPVPNALAFPATKVPPLLMMVSPV